VVGGAVGVVVGLLATFALRAAMVGDGDASVSGASGGSTTGAEGARSAPEALWLFGFDTVRVDPDTFEHAHRLGRPGFGEVRAYGHRVYMASRASGRVGVLDATTNEMREADGPPTDRTEGAEANLAVTEGCLWLVTGDGAVTSITRDGFDDPVTVEVGDGSAGGQTRVVAVSRRSVVAVVESASGLTLTLVTDEDRATRRVTRPAVSVSEGSGVVRGVASAGGRVWIAYRRELRWFDVAAARDTAWVLVANGARLLRYGVGSTRPEASVRLLADAPRTLRAQAAVVAGRGAIWALVPTGAEPGDHRAAVVRVDPDRDVVGERLDSPSDLFVGAIAVT